MMVVADAAEGTAPSSARAVAATSTLLFIRSSPLSAISIDFMEMGEYSSVPDFVN
jgi:hypothetical protein